ncbi:phosphatidylserine decarboxylase [Balneicella halophila]|uniref:Phosphatidylserine decarboxylase proenzyme n=1 Tax=Balneicella halophila TaxID=1537566 RepID=A0A7L4UMM6_BALHA|nr:phosphatidylserine decarboxylase family protein [Balneicella halophila]PVX49874.1 phosphatidylserine decarboxylase [Balneicella halophila]
MRLHKEGIIIISVALFLMLVINLGVYCYLPPIWAWIISIISIALFFLVVYFFREPKRIFNTINDAILCPCDGKVVVIEEVFETEYLKEKCIQISIFMSPLNVHINWHPISGKVLYSKHHSGKFYKAWLPKSSTDNERATVVTERADGVKILTRQIAGAMARRIVTYAKTNDEVIQGEQLGFIKFGSRVDVFVPLDAEIQVNLGQKVSGLHTVLAHVK